MAGQIIPTVSEEPVKIIGRVFEESLADKSMKSAIFSTVIGCRLQQERKFAAATEVHHGRVQALQNKNAMEVDETQEGQREPRTVDICRLPSGSVSYIKKPMKVFRVAPVQEVKIGIRRSTRASHSQRYITITISR